MGKRVLLKQAAKETGLSVHELRTGAISGKYPSMRVGGPHGKLIFDMELLEHQIRKIMMSNMDEDFEESEEDGYRRVRK